MAVAARISPLVIGLTVVAYGTSAPELAVSVHSALVNQADIALGNVVGSNIFNILFILGISAIITPLVVSSRLIRLDVPIMIGLAVLTMAMAWNGNINRLEGVILFVGALLYTILAVWKGFQENQQAELLHSKDSLERPTRWGMVTLRHIGLIVLGLALLVIGSRWLVAGAIAITQALGISKLIVGLTIVAAGTSLPEVATSIVAAVRRERDIAVGNVVGSNIFNILAVLGLTACVGSDGLRVSSAALNFDIPVMIAVCTACLLIFFTDHRIARWEGGLFFSYYIAYTGYLALSSTQHAVLPLLNKVMILFVLPLTGVTLVILAVRYSKRRLRVRNVSSDGA